MAKKQMADQLGGIQLGKTESGQTFKVESQCPAILPGLSSFARSVNGGVKVWRWAG
jgi:hypothetical protein